MAGAVKETGSLLVDTAKAAIIGAVGRGVGKAVGGNVGEAIGGVVAGVVQHKTGDKHDLGKVIALVSVMDFTHNMLGSGGAAEGQEKNIRPEM